MPELEPQPFQVLLARAQAELKAQQSIFDLPRRSFWRASHDLDLGVELPGGRARTPLGPAAGPHTQLAQNIAVSWLAGARTPELKTVQVRDRLEIPRPCIDAEGPGFNVEWSQELRLEESLAEYTSAWLLVHIFRAMGLEGEPSPGPAAVFEASVGYDLAGIRSEGVARFLDGLSDAAQRLRGLRDTLPRALRPLADVEVPGRIAACVTLSTFHGCPPGEIRQIVEHLLRRHSVSVVVKLNPTLLGEDAVEEIIRGRLGHRELRLAPEAFHSDLKWGEALGIFENLGPVAESLGLSLGAKLTNTLVVQNHKQQLPGDVMYLSGRPLHVLAVTLAEKLASATSGRLSMALSGGVDADNFAAVVSCGFEPVTTCTDLLQPNGYRRLPVYLRNLEAAMRSAGAPNVPAFIHARAGSTEHGAGGREPTRAAAMENLARYARQLADDPRYHAAPVASRPVRTRQLRFLDCDSCNKCLLACPNGAVFTYATEPGSLPAPVLSAGHGRVRRAEGSLAVLREKQWAVYAGFCNECGNCDTFCPEAGGPYRKKPRVYLSRLRFEADAPADGVLVESSGAKLTARQDGAQWVLERLADGDRFCDGRLEVVLDARGEILAIRPAGAGEGPHLDLARYQELRLLREGLYGRIHAASAAELAESGRSG